MAINNKYEKGNILSFEDNNLGSVIIVGETVQDDIQYLLVSSLNNTSYSGEPEISLLKVQEDDNVVIVTDKAIASRIIPEILKDE